MSSRRLTLALIALAATVVLQGPGAVWVLNPAQLQVERGRLASDIPLGLVELSAKKKELRSWVAPLQQGAGADPAVGDALQAALGRCLGQLQQLADAAQALDDSPAGRAEQLRRPLQQLSDGARALEEGRLDYRVPAQGDAEFAAVARSMNTMAAALAAPVADALGQAAPLAAERGVQLLCGDTHALPPSWPVLADPQRLRQLRMVLLDDAIGCSHRGGRVRVQVQAAEPGVLLLEVADEGIGIGLAMARALAQAHGGSLTRASELGRGTRAQLRLPPTGALPVGPGQAQVSSA